MNFNPYIPLNTLPELWPNQKLWRTIPVLEQTNKANRTLAELKGRLKAIPNPQIFIHTLTLQEAKESSEIENVITTTDKLFKAYTTEKISDAQTKEVLRYGKALMRAFNDLKKNRILSLQSIVSIYQTIKDETDQIRDFEVFIGNAYEKIYTPPCCKEVLTQKLNNWLQSANQANSMDSLIKMAMLHYQFEAIHPFKDRNGRTGRILNVLYLCQQNLLDMPILYLSKYINSYKNDYYAMLLSVTETQQWQGFLLFMLTAIEKTALQTLGKVNRIIELFEQTQLRLKKELPKVYSYELVEVLFTQVYSKYSFLEDRDIASRNTARAYFKELEKLGIIEKERIGNELIFKNVALYKLFQE